MRFASRILVPLFLCIGATAQNPSQPRPDVSGVTLDYKGSPLRKTDLMLVSLAAEAAGEKAVDYTAVSAPDGKFEFWGIAPGRYRLFADRAGYLRTKYGAKAQWAPGAVLTVRQGVPLAGLEIRMPEQAVISGRVEYDGPAGTLMIGLLQEQFQDGKRRMAVINTTTVELTGEFRFNRLLPGRYHLVARPPTSASDPGLDDDINIPTFYPGKPDQSTAEPIVLQEGQSVSANFSVLKSRCFRVSGTVGALPPGGGRVSVSLRSAVESVVPFSSSAMVEPDGTFQINSVPPGPYVLITSVQGGPEPRIVQQSIEVGADVAGVFVKPDVSAAPLAGSLKVEGGSAAAPLRLRLILRPIPPGIQSAAVQAGPDGSFRFGPLLPGLYRFQLVEDLPRGAYLKSAKLGDQDVLSSLDLTQPPGDARLEVVVSFAGAAIDGVILSEDGKPAEGTATLIPDPPQPEQQWLYRVAEAGEGGRFKFQGVRPGKYLLYAWEELEPGSHMDPEVTASRKVYSVPIEVKEKESKTVTVKRIAAEATPAQAAGRR